jgi:hypothetical protein
MNENYKSRYGGSAPLTSHLAGLAPNHHVENLPVLGHLYPTGALGELDQGFIAEKAGAGGSIHLSPPICIL